MSVVEVNEKNYQEEVSSGLVIIDVWAKWCGPCKIVSPILDEVSNETTDVKIGKVDADENGSLVSSLNIMSIPTLLLYKDGELIDKKVGVQSKETLLNWVSDHK